jgi:hypothetical protein
VVATVEWMKDGPEGEVIVSRLEPVNVGVDADNDPVSTCIITPTEDEAVPFTGKLSGR